ncbi:MAG: hypothetical protein J7M20_04965, partial [Deltaproteobacteria bacterium]|nr:hypothetical protein [Deltaproteobacteria bacterium]
MLILDFCNITEWSPSTVLDLYKKNGVIHSRQGAHDGFEKYCLSNRGPKSLVFLLVKASEIGPWLSEDNEIVSLAKWLRVHCALSPFNDGYSEIWRHLQQSREEFYAPFLDKCSKGDLDLDFINDILADFQEIGFSMAFSGQPDKWDSKSGITWHFRDDYLETLEDHINWEILSNFLAQKTGVFKKVRK